jgi:histidinol-phosphate aminotransferase
MPILPKKSVQDLTAWPPASQDRLAKIRLDAGEHTTGFGQFLPFELPPDLVATYPMYEELLSNLGRIFGVTPQHILLTNGSDEGLELIAETFIEPGVSRAICNTPSFIIIPRSMQRAGALLEQVPVDAQTMACDVAKVTAALSEKPAQLAMFASPDNPTGMTIEFDTVQRWCKSFPDTLFVIDEAYFEFTRRTCLPLVSTYKNLIVTRTFSKAWGMAGLRIGMLIGAPETIAHVAKVALIYNVNAIAVAVANQMLKHRDAVLSAAQATMQRKRDLIDAIGPERVHEGEANFFLLDVGPRATEFAQHCDEHGILVRVCAPKAQPSDPLYGKLRVSVGTAAECDRFLAAMRTFLGQLV